MKTYLLIPALFTIITTPLISAQTTTLPSTLPACAQQCTILTNAQSSCASNAAAYQSCFCQSALLSQLFNAQPVQLCTQCSAADMLTIQNWYKGQCQPGAAANGQPTTTSSSSTTALAPSTRSTTTSTPTATAVTNNEDSSSAQNAPSGPWMSTHYKWVVMLIVLFFGLIAAALTFWWLHRRYHRRREAQWSQAVGSHPNINTWGPGQSVHDLGLTPGAGAIGEKGKGKEQVRGVNEPPPARMRENRLSKI